MVAARVIGCRQTTPCPMRSQGPSTSGWCCDPDVSAQEARARDADSGRPGVWLEEGHQRPTTPRAPGKSRSPLRVLTRLAPVAVATDASPGRGAADSAWRPSPYRGRSDHHSSTTPRTPGMSCLETGGRVRCSPTRPLPAGRSRASETSRPPPRDRPRYGSARSRLLPPRDCASPSRLPFRARR